VYDNEIALRKWSSGGTAHAHLRGNVVHHKAFQHCRSWRSITDHITRSTGPFIFTTMPRAKPRTYHNDKWQIWGPTAFDGLRAAHQLNVVSQHIVHLLKYLAHLKLSSHTPANLARNNLMFHRNHMGWMQNTELAMDQALHGFLKWPECLPRLLSGAASLPPPLANHQHTTKAISRKSKHLTSGVSAGHIIPQSELCSWRGLASLPSLPIGELSRLRWDKVDAYVNLFSTCDVTGNTNQTLTRKHDVNTSATRDRW